MSGVEAVAWTSQTQMEAVRITGDGIMCRASHPKWQVALYSQQSIDTLRAQLEAVEADRNEWKEAAETYNNARQQAVERAEAAEAECARLKASLGAIHYHAGRKGQHAIQIECAEAVPALAEIARTKEETK